MDGQDEQTIKSSSMTTTVPHASSRPTLGFPLGTALLLVVIFSLSGVFSCCYHWDRVRSLRRRLRSRSYPTNHNANGAAIDDTHANAISSPLPKNKNSSQHLNQDKDESLPVIMPGNQIPTYMAWPCPCHRLPPPLSLPLKIVVVDVHVPQSISLPPPVPPPSLETPNVVV